jgi:hypothetical protein
MGNLLQYADKSTTIDNKLDSLLSQINYDYNNGNIRTETEYYYRIKNMLTDFYDSLTKPTFQYRPAVSTPMSDEYNSMITEAYSDMEYIIKDCEALNKLVSQSFIDAELGRNMMSNELAYTAKKIAAIGESIAKNQPLGTVVFVSVIAVLVSPAELPTSPFPELDDEPPESTEPLLLSELPDVVSSPVLGSAEVLPLDD